MIQAYDKVPIPSENQIVKTQHKDAIENFD